MEQVLERFKQIVLTEIGDGAEEAEVREAIAQATCIEDAITATAGAAIDMPEAFCMLISAVSGDDKPEWFLPEFDT